MVPSVRIDGRTRWIALLLRDHIDSVRADISNRQDGARKDFALKVQIVLNQVGRLIDVPVPSRTYSCAARGPGEVGNWIRRVARSEAVPGLHRREHRIVLSREDGAVIDRKAPAK